MSTLITPVGQRTEIRAPENTELGDAGALISTTVQPIVNNIEWQRGRTPACADTYWIQLPLSAFWEVGTTWNEQYNNTAFISQSTNNTVGLRIDMSPFLPQRCTLTAAQVAIKPNTGHDNLPALPYVRILRRGILDLPDAAITEQMLATDAVATVSAYQAAHLVGFAEAAIEIHCDVGYQYQLELVGERSDGDQEFIAGLVVLAARVQVAP